MIQIQKMNSLWIILVITTFVPYIYLKLFKPLQKWKNLRIPFVKPVPIFGNTLPFVLQRKTMADCVKDMYNSHDSRYVGLYEFNLPILMIKDLNLIKQLGIKDFDNFCDHRQTITEDVDPLFGKVLMFLSGQKWRNMRATLSPAFSGSKIRSMFILMSDCAEQFTDHFVKQWNPAAEHMTFEMKDIFTRFANDMIASCAFGMHCDSMEIKDNQFYVMGKKATNFGALRTLKFFLYGLFPYVMRLLKVKVFSDDICNFFRTIITDNIKNREEKGIIRPDMIQLLMEARKGRLKHENHTDNDTGFATAEESEIGKDVKLARLDLSDDDITAQALLFFIAGFDAVSSVMCHMAYELAINIDVQEKLQKELDETLEEHNGNISYETIIKMKYLDMVISESLRKWPTTTVVDRICRSSYIIAPENSGEERVHLRKGDLIWFPIYALHRDPKYFPNPDKFDPERFSDENKHNIKQFSYIPFGVGPRNCIGSRFALLEIKVLFVHLLKKFNFILCEKSQVPLQIKKGEFTINAENGFWLGLQLRKNN